MRQIKFRKYLYDLDRIEVLLNEGLSIPRVAVKIEVTTEALRYFLNKCIVSKKFEVQLNHAFFEIKTKKQ